MKSKNKICVICKNSLREEMKFFPFCSARCQLIDLGNWLGEKYPIAGEKTSPEQHLENEVTSLQSETT